MNLTHVHRVRLVLLTGLLIAILVVPNLASAQVDQASPQLAVRDSSHAEPGAIVVNGTGFTPGGEVKVFILGYYHEGVDLLETRPVVAAEATFGPNGSVDPALGYTPGGTFSETFRSLCDTTAMVRAYDAQLDAWTEVPDIEPRC